MGKSEPNQSPRPVSLLLWAPGKFLLLPQPVSSTLVSH